MSRAQQLTNRINEAKVTFKKIDKKDAKKTDNHEVVVDGIVMGVIGRQTIEADSKVVFFSKDEQTKKFDGKEFKDMGTAKGFFKNIK